MKFIHFGCWNNGKCEINTTNNGLSSMVTLLNKIVKENDIEFITVAGDNYYPKKDVIEGKKVKKFSKDDFISGFECLPKDIKKYILFGNHDIEDIVVEDDDKDEKKCTALLFQKSLSDKEYKIFDDVIVKAYNKTLIIMLDTTIYTMADNFDISETCYKYLFNESKINKIMELIKYQENRIKSILDENNLYKNIIFIGHHPIISEVSKKNTNIIKPEDKIIELFREIKNLLEDKNIYYLCADTHFYQESRIDIGELCIYQFIVGTGGTDQDTLPIEPFIDKYKDINYNIVKQEKSFGFIIIDVEDEVKIEYKSTNIYGGYYNKYLKYKQKYLKLKLKI